MNETSRERNLRRILCMCARREDKALADMTWDEVFAIIKRGEYKQKFNIGDTHELDLGSEGKVNMAIAAFDTDELADGSGTAPITWISVQLLKTNRYMSPSNTDTGGWESSTMRTYLRDTVKPLIPATVAGQIKEVKKYSYRKGTNTANAETTDDVWIPSWREVNLGSGRETTGPNYSTLFPDAASRIKMKTGATSAISWWLRSVSNIYATYFNYVATGGTSSSTIASIERGVSLGFCT